LQEILGERKKRRDEAMARALEFALCLRQTFGKASVMLYGSYARGDFNLWSDVDVLVVSEGFQKRRVLERGDLFEAPPDFEVKSYTPEEFAKIARDPSWLQALKEGVIILDDYGLFDQLDAG